MWRRSSKNKSARVTSASVLVAIPILAMCMGSGASARVLSIAQVIQRSAEFKGHRIVTRGYFVIEPEDRNLWFKGAAYREGGEPCISLDIPDSIFNKREALNRRDIIVSGIVTISDCAPNECLAACNRVGLRDIKIVAFEGRSSPAALLSRMPNDTSLLVNNRAPDQNALLAFGLQLKTIFSGVASGQISRRKLLSVVPREYEAIISSALSKSDSRLNWLLFTGKASIGKQLEKAPFAKIDIVQTEPTGDDQQNFICYCLTRGYCEPNNLTSSRVYFRAADDPYFCVPVQHKSAKWNIDAGFLVGRPYEDHMH